MADLKFSQSERPNFLVPGLIALAVIGGIFVGLAYFTPHQIALVSVTHTAILPTHTAFKSSSIVVAEDPSQDDLYVLTTVKVQNTLKIPLFIKDITATLETAEGTTDSESAVEKNDIENLYTTFPKLKPLASAPLYREITIEPGQSAEGMVLLHFPITQAVWDSRKSATVYIDLYHQGKIPVVIPKP
jgi:hypothetical protein